MLQVRSEGKSISGDREMFPAPPSALPNLVCPVLAEVLLFMGHHLPPPNVIRTTGVNRQPDHRDFKRSDIERQRHISSGLPISALQSFQDGGSLAVILNESFEGDTVDLGHSHYARLDQGDIIVFNGLLPYFDNSYENTHTRVHWCGREVHEVGADS